MMRQIATAAIAASVVLVGMQARADKVVLVDGREIVGDVTIQGPKFVWVRAGEADLKIARDEIVSLTIDEPPPKPELQMEQPDFEAFKRNAIDDCPTCLGRGYTRCKTCGGNWERAAVREPCERCKGTGRIICFTCAGEGRVRCSGCGGDGTVRVQTGWERGRGMKQPIFGDQTCSKCGGSGKLPCPVCSSPATDPLSPAGKPEVHAAAGRFFGRHSGGRGIIRCPVCKGTGETVVHKRCPDCDHGYAACADCSRIRNKRRAREAELAALRSDLIDARRRTLVDYFDVLNGAAHERIAYDSTSPERYSLSPEAVPDRTILWLQVNEPYKEEPYYQAVARHLRPIQQFFRQMPGVTASKISFYAPSVPFELAAKDGKLAFVLKGLVSEYKLNLIQMREPKARATEMLRMFASPLCAPLHATFGDSDFEYFGMVVHFGSSNFLTEKDDEAEGLRAETAAILMGRAAVEQFARGRITFEELLRRSECFMADRYRGAAGGLVKVALP